MANLLPRFAMRRLCKRFHPIVANLSKTTTMIHNQSKSNNTINTVRAFSQWIPEPSPADQKDQYWNRRKDEDLEKASRDSKLTIDLVDSTKLSNEEWLSYGGAERTKAMAQHNRIFSDVFDSEPWLCTINLKVEYDQGAHIHRGNILKPSQVAEAPSVSFDADPSTTWTIAMVSPDGLVGDRPSVDIHWMMNNITGGSELNGDTSVEYKPPSPIKGTGFYRYVFILLQQSQHVHVDADDTTRATSIPEFVKFVNASPSGLSFFQSRCE